MKNIARFFAIILSLFILLLSGCGTPSTPSVTDTASNSSSTPIPEPEPEQKPAEEKTSSDTIYPMEYMGIWYGFGTDGTEAQAEFEVTSINSNQISINGQTLTFRNSYIAESSIVTAGNGRSSKTLYILGKDSNGELAIEIYTVDANTNKQFTQSMCCYRQSSRENIQDFIPNGEV